MFRSSSSSLHNPHQIPSEIEALRYCPPLSPNVVLIPGGVTWPHTVINRVVTVSSTSPPTSYIDTIDSALSDRALPSYPSLPGQLDQIKSEQIRRTVYVTNLDPRVSFENLYDLFSQVGDISAIRMTRSVHGVVYSRLGLSNLVDEHDSQDVKEDSVGAFIEYSEQPSIIKALCLNGIQFAKRRIRVNHSTSAIPSNPDPSENVTLDELKKERELAKIARSRKRHSSQTASSRTSELAKSSRKTSRSRSRSRTSRRRHRRSGKDKRRSGSTSSARSSAADDDEDDGEAGDDVDETEEEEKGKGSETEEERRDEDNNDDDEDDDASTRSSAEGSADESADDDASSPPPRKKGRATRSRSRSTSRATK